MASRLSLQSELKSLIGVRTDNKQNVYFQPPESVKLVYPCIIYKLARPEARRADNKVYKFTQCYEITVIYTDPDYELPKEILHHFEYVDLDRYFTSDNLYHAVFTLFY